MVERRDQPLFAWGEALRSARRRRRRLARRIALTGPGCSCLLATIVAPPLPRLAWNVSASMPVGLYAVQPGEMPSRGEIAVARLPAAVRDLAARRRYIPIIVPLVKRVAGVAGDRVCADGDVITIQGHRTQQRVVLHPGPPLCFKVRQRPIADVLQSAPSADHFSIEDSSKLS